MKFATILLLVLLIPAVSATTYHTTLLTVSEDEDHGGTADVYLEIQPGSGRIFIDSFPISKADTQFSTRFANEVACDFLRKNCDRYDFFYTIRADSTVVGGPSAGAAITVLTVAALDGQQLNQDVAMTGTVNSGGSIGSVGGIVAKINAAKENNMTTVIIPAVASLGLQEKNSSINQTVNTSVEYDLEILNNLSQDGFVIVQAADLYDALPYFIDKKYPLPNTQLEAPKSYSDIMANVTDVLCERRNALLLRNDEDQNRTQEIDENVAAALNASQFYSAASFCFSQNIELQQASLEDVREDALKQRLRDVKNELVLLDSFVSQQNLTTIGDVETTAIVRERIVEAADRANKIESSNISVIELAYVIERAFSARVWSDFFAMESTPYTINENHLRNACLNKISEAEERITFAEGFVPDEYLESSREELQFARRDFAKEEFAVCLFKAAKAKAEANVIVSSVAVSHERVDLLVEQKLVAVDRVLSRQAEAGLFPIMGYSYYEYAQSLAEDQPYSALTFAEYALELSNLQMYFPREEPWYEPFIVGVDWEIVGVFLFGLVVGLVAFGLVKK